MFLAVIATGCDVFHAEDEVLRVFGEGHPALEYLMTTALNWPAVDGNGLMALFPILVCANGAALVFAPAQAAEMARDP